MLSAGVIQGRTSTTTARRDPSRAAAASIARTASGESS
jgi:hypothetical protein